MSEASENQLEGNNSPEISVEERLAGIAEELGFKETPELVQARKELKPDDLIDESIRKIVAYQELGAELVEAEQGAPDPKLQIGLLVAVARLKYASGFYDDYREDMINLMFYAGGVGEHETVKNLRRIFFEYLDPEKNTDFPSRYRSPETNTDNQN